VQGVVEMFEAAQRAGPGPGPERVVVEMGVSEEQAAGALATTDAAATSVVGIAGHSAGSSVSAVAAVFELAERESVYGCWPPLWPLEDSHILVVALPELEVAPLLKVVLQTDEVEQEQGYEYHSDEKQHCKFESSPFEHFYLLDLSEIARSQAQAQVLE